MTRPILRAAVVALALFAAFPATQALAGPVERACMSSDRRAANPALCRCIQRVADMSLGGGDQRQVAKFMRDPDAAQEKRMSKRDSDDAFWDRYVAFGASARAYCSS